MTKDGQVVLSHHIKRKFLEKLERVFQQKREHKFKHGRTKNSGLNNCEEITIAKITIQNLADYGLNKTNFFSIYNQITH